MAKKDRKPDSTLEDAFEPTARQYFESAKGQSNDEATKQIANGLIELSRAIEEQLKKIERRTGS
jgi:hypothetical protein